jgi:hypothetical protein
MSPDTIWKIVSTGVSILIVPLFIWVWNTNAKIEHMSSEYNHTVEDVKELKSVTDKMDDDQSEMKTDIRLIQQKLDRLESMTEELLKMAKESK